MTSKNSWKGPKVKFPRANAYLAGYDAAAACEFGPRDTTEKLYQPGNVSTCSAASQRKWFAKGFNAARQWLN